MKKYVKPTVKVDRIITDNIANLSSWLEGNEFNQSELSITIYDMQS